MSCRPFALIGILAVSVALLSTTPARSGAQMDLDSLRAAHTCATALRIVTLGQPDKNEAWAWSSFPGCGTTASGAARDAWLAQRFVSDLGQLRDVFGHLWNFQDDLLFEAAMSIADDRSAASPSRVYSMMMLFTQVFDTEFAGYDEMTSMPAVPAHGFCRIDNVFGRSIRVGTPLSADARQRVRSLAQSLAANASAPATVRSAGRCLEQALLIDDKVQASKAIVPPGAR